LIELLTIDDASFSVRLKTRFDLKKGGIMETKGWLQKFTFLVLGVILATTVFFLTGAAGVPEVGRYQMEAIPRGNSSDLYVIDTTSGEIKWLDFKDQGKPFGDIEVKKGLFD
jgi:hypothetical protein